MVEMMKRTSHWWWFETHHGSKRSPWLETTLGELEKKTKAMLKLIEADADSFAQRAEMYYKKRPELVSMVEDFYKAHRLLAEGYDQLKSDSGHRLLTTLGSPFSTKYQPKETCAVNQSYDSHSETSDLEDCAHSEVNDPEQEDGMQEDKAMGEAEEHEQKEQIDEEIGEDEASTADYNDEVMKLRDEIGRLREENNIQKDQLLRKDEEKREVIRQLSVAVEVLKLENGELRKYLSGPKKRSSFEFKKLKQMVLGKFFNGSPKLQGSVVGSL